MRPISAWALRPGDALAPGRRIIRRLAGGGAHEVFLVDAEEPAVAKLPRPHVAHDPHCLAQLAREGRALDRLSRCGVPRLVDAVVDGPMPHLLLEYIPGPSLREAITMRGALDAPAVARIGHHIARALERLAGASWVHLDVKPANIVLSPVPRLVDFELACTEADAARMTAPTGTWQYMPPEQRGAGGTASAQIGPPADVFALAVSLGEALLGRPVRRHPAPERLPGPVGRVLGTALTAWPAQRPSAAHLGDALIELAGPALDMPELREAA